MARSAEGVDFPSRPCDALDAEHNAFLTGLEGVIDRALRNHRPGARFVFGIHQALAPAIEECVVQRYRDAGWREVRVVPGATGAATLILAA